MDFSNGRRPGRSKYIIQEVSGSKYRWSPCWILDGAQSTETFTILTYIYTTTMAGLEVGALVEVGNKRNVLGKTVEWIQCVSNRRDRWAKGGCQGTVVQYPKMLDDPISLGRDFATALGAHPATRCHTCALTQICQAGNKWSVSIRISQSQELLISTSNRSLIFLSSHHL